MCWLFVVSFLSTTLLTSQEGAIRVMSFNIRYPNPNDGLHDWDHRRPLVASLLQYHDPDILGVQEAFRRQLDEMKEDMPQYQWYGVCRTDGTTQPQPDGEFSAILYRHDRFQRLDGGTFWLSGTPDVAGSKSWDAALPRIVTWARFRDKRNNTAFFFFNTHFDHMGEEARKESAGLLLQKMESIAGDAHLILTGDFNCRDTSPPYKILTDTTTRYALTDAMSVSQIPHHGPVSTFSGDFLSPRSDDGNRIDYIFVRGLVAVYRHATLTDSWGGNLPSDHLPVLADINWP